MEIVKFRTQILHFNVTPKELRKRRLRQSRLNILYYSIFCFMSERMVFLMRDAVIVSACRTAIGSFNGQFADITAVDLGIAAVTEAIKRAGVPVDQIDEVIMGHVSKPVAVKTQPVKLPFIRVFPRKFQLSH